MIDEDAILREVREALATGSKDRMAALVQFMNIIAPLLPSPKPERCESCGHVLDGDDEE